MENLIQEINGIKYLLFNTEIALSSSGYKQAIQLDNKIKSYKGIIHYIEEVSSFWGTSKIKAKFLIPEDKAVQFTKDKLDNY